MKIKNAAAMTAAMAMMATPAFAYDGSDNPGAQNKPENTPTRTDTPGTERKPDASKGKPDATPGPKAGLPAKAKAYGRYCKGQSKKHVKGEKGTPFSKCVTAMAKLANGSTKNPRTACKSESKKHVKGEKGTPFSKCVSGGAKLLKDQAAD